MKLFEIKSENFGRDYSSFVISEDMDSARSLFNNSYGYMYKFIGIRDVGSIDYAYKTTRPELIAEKE